MKKLIILLALLFPMLALAQDIEGTWKFHPAYQLSAASELIDTENHVYALSNGAIVCLDKASGQIQALSPATGLSEAKVKSIYYNYDKHYLLIAYTSSNIDLLYDDGHIVNISALADAVMNISRSINDVSFADGIVYVATDFGLIVIDEQKESVIEFRNYNKALTSVARVGEHTIIAYEGKLFASNNRRELLSDFHPLDITQDNARLRTATDNTFFLLGDKALKRCTMSINEKGDTSFVATDIVLATPNNLQRSSGGWLANFRANSFYYTISNDGNYTATKVTGNNTSLYSSAPDGDGTIWQIDGNGIHIKGATNYYKPGGIYTYNNASPVWFYSYYNTMNDKFYITSFDQRYAYDPKARPQFKAYLLSYDGNNWTDETPTKIRNLIESGPLALVPWHNNALFYTIRSNNNLFRVVDGQVDLTFVQGVNHPYTGLVLPRIAFDSQGNLWMCSTRAAAPEPKDVACMLPKDKVMNPTVTKDDWIVVSVPGMNMPGGTFQNQTFCIGKGDVKVTHDGYQGSLAFTLWRGTPNATNSTVESVRVSDPVDQNGKAIDKYNNYLYTMTNDSTGYIWVGSSNSPVFYFDPAEVIENGFKVTRPIVSDGEDSPFNLAVSYIATDYLNRKWIATIENGLYVTSPDGSRVLKHFDVDNSLLPSSKVYSVVASPNRAIVLTANGVVEFDMTDIPQSIDYTAVTAAPMFVEPSYTGFVTIGQVDVGACVRITDRDGNVVREFTATSNQVAWDTCDETGERVPTGVYSIYAGLTAEQLPATPQARVKIIK